MNLPEIQRYTFGEFLGDGRFAVVYRAQDTHLEREVAFKLMREEHVSGDLKWYEAFDIEVDLLQRLVDLPTVVTILDHGVTSDGRPYIGLELVPPGTDLLTHVTHEGRLSEAEGLPIMWQLTDLLHEAHARDIAYRDLKLEHVFWSDGRMTLIDWNVSRGYTTESAGDEIDLEWEKERNFQGDLFKLGTVFYSVFTGLDIRDRQVPTPVYSQLEESGFSLTDEGIVWPIDFADVPLSPELEDIILRLIHIDVDQRYQSAASVREALEERARHLDITLERPTKPTFEPPSPPPTEVPHGWRFRLVRWWDEVRS